MIESDLGKPDARLNRPVEAEVALDVDVANAVDADARAAVVQTGAEIGGKVERVGMGRRIGLRERDDKGVVAVGPSLIGGKDRISACRESAVRRRGLRQSCDIDAGSGVGHGVDLREASSAQVGAVEFAAGACEGGIDLDQEAGRVVDGGPSVRCLEAVCSDREVVGIGIAADIHHAGADDRGAVSV